MSSREDELLIHAEPITEAHGLEAALRASA